MLGWRKLSAWALVFVMCAAALYLDRDIPVNAKDLIMWVTGFFFGANMLKPLTQNIKVNLGNGKS